MAANLKGSLMPIATALDHLRRPPCAELLGWHVVDARPADGWIRIGFEGRNLRLDGIRPRPAGVALAADGSARIASAQRQASTADSNSARAPSPVILMRMPL